MRLQQKKMRRQGSNKRV